MKHLFFVFIIILVVAAGYAQSENHDSEMPANFCDHDATSFLAKRMFLPDLIGGFTSVSDLSLSPEEVFTVNYSVSNYGDENAGASDTKFYFSLDQTFGDGDDIYIGQQACVPLAISQTIYYNVDLTVPSYIGQGTWYLFFKVDASDNVNEANEDNNVVQAPQAFTIVSNVPQITLLSPNGGETWLQGSSYDIQWTYSVLTGNVKIDLLQGTSSSTVMTIAASTPIANGSFSWLIPTSLNPASNYKIRITSLSDLNIYDISNNYFTINPSPSITLITPNGGETWEKGSTQAITWTYVSLSGQVKLELMQGTGSTPIHTISSTTALNAGSFDWIIPNTISEASNYKVRITSLSNGSVNDLSDGYFTIQEPPSITVTSPNGGESWLMGSTHNITWSSINLTGNVKIDLTQGTSSTPVQVISNSTPVSSESYSWTIPSTLTTSSNYKIRISSLSNGSVADASDNYFSLDPPAAIEVISPNGGETWLQGHSYAIAWTFSSLIGNVRIDLLQGTETTPVATIVSSTALSTGIYNWTVPYAIEAASNYKVKITSLSDGSVYDTSNNYFTVNPAPSITVISPNGGEEWQLGSTNSVSWTYLSLTGNVKIELLQGANNTPVLTLSSSVPASSGSFDWTIPVSLDPGTNYKIRVSSLVYDSVNDVSDAYFSVVSPPSLTLLSPNGGENWLLGATYSIVWTSETLVGNIKIELMQNGVLANTISTSSSVNTGSYNWTIPTDLPLGANYRIKITSLVDDSVSDQSDNNFTIATSAITVDSPNGLEIWVAGVSYDVLWTAQNVSGNVKIELYRGTGTSPVAMIHSSLPASVGEYHWLVPTLTFSNDYLVKITSLDDPNVYDFSDAYFSISGVANEDQSQVPVSTGMVSCYPNPFNPSTTISYGLHTTAEVTLKVFNSRGCLVKTLYTGLQNAGYHSVTWDGSSDSGTPSASGVYTLLLTAGNHRSHEVITLIK